MKIIIWVAFAFVVAAQWYVPISLVTKSEDTLSDGEEFRFKTRPIDPSDPFRGKYITLDFEASVLHLPDTLTHLYEEGEAVFASIDLDSAGFAIVDSLFVESPQDFPLPVVKARVNYAYIEPTGTQYVELTFPFVRFYMEESKASEAEQVYWQANRWNDSTGTPTYAVVRIRDEHAVLVDVIVNDSSIVDIVRRMNRDK